MSLIFDENTQNDIAGEDFRCFHSLVAVITSLSSVAADAMVVNWASVAIVRSHT